MAEKIAKGKIARKAKKEESGELKAARLLFKPFLNQNPSASITETSSKPKFRIIQRPWGDPSVVFLIPNPPEPFAAVLNGLVLPDRLSAIYHVEESWLEVIFTAYRLPDELQEVIGRKFNFTFRDTEYSCEFGDSSERLISLARETGYFQATTTGFRNLQSYSAYTRQGDGPGGNKVRPGGQELGKPVSFHVRNFQWKGEESLDILRHISFFLKYYDNESPFILIHPPVDETVVNPRTRYVKGAFPEDIKSRELNPILLSFWSAAAHAEMGTKFLLYYRILEFVTSFYLQQDKLSAVSKVLAAPDISKSLPQAIDNLVAIIREDRPDSPTRFSKMVTELVNAELIWREICANPGAFTEVLKFDGGFALEPLVASTKSPDCFGPQGLHSVARSFRKIRNALSHGGEAQSGEVILPTENNLKKLQPWVHLIAVAAGEVVLYEHLT